MTKCSVSDCEEYSHSIIAIPKSPRNKESFHALPLCKYHFERFEERYLDKEHDYYEDAKSMT